MTPYSAVAIDVPGIRDGPESGMDPKPYLVCHFALNMCLFLQAGRIKFDCTVPHLDIQLLEMPYMAF